MNWREEQKKFQERKRVAHGAAVEKLTEKYGQAFTDAWAKESQNRFSSVLEGGEYELEKWWLDKNEAAALAKKVLDKAVADGATGAQTTFRDALFLNNVGALRKAAALIEKPELSWENIVYLAFIVEVEDEEESWF